MYVTLADFMILHRNGSLHNQGSAVLKSQGSLDSGYSSTSKRKYLVTPVAKKGFWKHTQKILLY